LRENVLDVERTDNVNAPVQSNSELKITSIDRGNAEKLMMNVEASKFWNRFLQGEGGSFEPPPVPPPTKEPQEPMPTTPVTLAPSAVVMPSPSPVTPAPVAEETTVPATPVPVTEAPTTRKPESEAPTKAPVTAPIPDDQTVADIIATENNLSSLENALVAAGLVEPLSGAGSFTVFAPINAAFTAIPREYRRLLLSDERWILHLQNILLFHVTDSGALLSSDLFEDQEIQMLNGEAVVVRINGVVSLTSRFTTGSNVVAADLEGTNGVVHEVNGVLLPNSVGLTILDLLGEREEFSTLLDLIRLAELEEAVATEFMTLIAPTNAAFEAFIEENGTFLLDNVEALRSTLLYHVIAEVLPSQQLEDGFYVTANGLSVQVTVSDQGISFDDSTVEEADILGFNGIIHGVGSVLFPPVPS
jgi:uncharacterized surface protein with fasciclin (FAS1) repeats